jgi:hypothetical protein
MITLALLIGVFGYLIYLLGITHLFYSQVIILTTSIYWGVTGIIFRESLMSGIHSLTQFQFRKTHLLLIPLFILAAINLVGALGPELAFDALWYHLTLPKIYLLDHSIHVIPGGLLYYSGMPQLGEMYYLVALAIHGETLAKLIHFLFGILSCGAIYLLSKKFLSQGLSLLVVIIFSSNLVVAWESTTAYIDLIRTFFEITALLSLCTWGEHNNSFYLKASGLLLGVEIGTKLLAIGSLPLFLVGVYVLSTQKTAYEKIKECLLFIFWMMIPVLPWLIAAFLQTGNPVYPFFTSLYETAPRMGFYNPVTFLKNIFFLFTQAADPVSPLYLIVFPLIPFIWRKVSHKESYIFIYSLLGLIIWYITPDTGGGRFILPYLPGLSLLIGILVMYFLRYDKRIAYGIVGIAGVLCITTMAYRSVANARYVPVILGKETKDTFLSKHLNFSYGDFYDTDHFFKDTLSQKDRVLLIGFHNLYYVKFPFIDASWQKKNDIFNYIATQHVELPNTFSSWKKIYYNKITDVTVYTQ